MTTQASPLIDVDAAIERMVEIIVEGWDPVQIILFGSRARGDHREDSDVDLLVVLDEVTDYSVQCGAIGRALDCTRTARDIKLATPADVVRKATVGGTIERAAMLEGKTLHVRGRGDPVIEQAQRWLDRAKQDSRAARNQMTTDPPELAWACFIAQQTAEKSLKGALVLEGIDPPRTHDLNELRDLLPDGWEVPGSSGDLEQLSKWAEQSRYFNGWDEITRADAVWGIEAAQAIYEAVSAELARRGM